MEPLAGKRVTVMGLGRFGGGVGVTRWLVAQGARVLVTDRVPADALRESVAQIADLPITLRLGEHRHEDFREADLVVVNPAVPDQSEFVRTARDAGVPLTTEINLFVERCPARTIGVTGSVGKSTTTTMIEQIARRCAPAGVWVGGNLGRSLLDDVPRMMPRDVVILELSSFQLHRTPHVRWSPNVALVTNLSPNHLDWHGSLDEYADDKLNIARWQRYGDVLVLGDHAPLHDAARAAGQGARAWICGADGSGAFVRRPEGNELRWPTLRLGVPGRHNLENAAAALAAAAAIGFDGQSAAAALAEYAGLDHRLQRVCQRDGVTYYNDSKSTTPESAMTALGAIEGPLLVILGGYDKGSDLTEIAHVAARRAKFCACLGQTGPRIAERVRAAGGQAEIFADMPSAVAACEARAVPGDTILLSPACASWGMFEDFRQRGAVFSALARRESAATS